MIEHHRAMPLVPFSTAGHSHGLKEIVEAGFRHRGLFIAAGLGVLALTALWTFATPRRYTSTLSLLVQNARVVETVSSEGTLARTPLQDVTEEQMNSEIGVLGSTDLLDEVVDPGWSVSAKSASRSDLLLHNRRVEDLRRALDITTPRKSHVITVSLAAPSPMDGQKMLNRLLVAFLQKQRELSHPPGSLQFFTEQVERYRRDLTLAQQALGAYQQEHRFVSLPTHEASLEQKILELNAMSASNEVEMAATQKRISADERTLSTIAPRQATLQRTLPAAGTIDQLNTLDVTLRNRRAELLTKFKPNDRLIQEVDQQLAETEAGLARVKNSTSAEMSTDVNPTWQFTHTDLTQARASLDSLRGRADMLHQQIADLQRSLSTSELLSPEFSVLQSRVSELEAMYQSMLQKRDAAAMDESMDAQRWLNVAVIESPTLAVTPTHPRPIIDMSLGIVSALLLACLLVFLAEAGRTTMALPSEVEVVTDTPVLATVPLRNAGKQLAETSAIDEQASETALSRSGSLSQVTEYPSHVRNYPHSNPAP
jgi:uncharacterized protein involved in exopolysaccharide biosynthesis